MEPCWTIEAKDKGSAARCGSLVTRSGELLPTPLFQPVATSASLKTLDWQDVSALGYRHVLMNTYHLAIKPGVDTIQQAGGIKGFSGWPGSVLTDSGGYQVFSLAAQRSIKPTGVSFTDHIDGNRWEFTPSFVLETQLRFRVDFAMCLDVCTGLPASRNRVAEDMALTHTWAKEQAELWPELRERWEQPSPPANQPTRLFGIVQGGLEEDLRKESAQIISGLRFDGIAVGGLAVGEPREDLLRLIEHTGKLLPKDKVHYLMGIGNPADILFAIAQGFDMFDCVQPTRLARHGQAFTRLGRLKLRQARFKDDLRPLDEKCRCPVCRTYSRAYLRHLFVLKEHSYSRLVTIHNLAFYRDLLRRARKRILAGNYSGWWEKQFGKTSGELPAGA